MAYLLGITVGPVQINIQESRKLMDLKGSSKMLSDIMKETKKYIQNKAKDKPVEIIYPIVNNENDIIDSSNYMVCIIDNINQLKTMQEKVYSNIQGISPQQLSDAYYMFWAVEEIEQVYDEAYKKMTKKLKDIKNTYDFNQDERYGFKKCTICGKRNPIKDHTPKNRLDELCAVCAHKRKYNRQASQNEKILKSVYHVSLKPWKDNNEKYIKTLGKNLEKIIILDETVKYYKQHKIKNLIKGLNNLKNQCISKNIPYNHPNIPQSIREFIDDLQEPIKTQILNEGFSKVPIECLILQLSTIKDKMDKVYQSTLEPHYQYCFLQMDIDNLGKWMSGRYCFSTDNLKEEQRNISEVIFEFTNKIKKDIPSNCQIIYAGGDDFLAILPVEEILNVVAQIKSAYHHTIQKKINHSFEYKEYMRYSMSITIANCQDDMAVALRKSREELDKVKEFFEHRHKNGVAINYLLNTSKCITTYLKEDTYDMFVENIKHFNGLRKQEAKLSFSYITAFAEEFQSIQQKDLEIEEIDTIIEMMKIEWERLLKRSYTYENKNNIKEALENYTDTHKQVFEKILKENINDKEINLANIIDGFRIYEKFSKIEYVDDVKEEEAHETHETFKA